MNPYLEKVKSKLDSGKTANTKKMVEELILVIDDKFEAFLAKDIQSSFSISVYAALLPNVSVSDVEYGLASHYAGFKVSFAANIDSDRTYEQQYIVTLSLPIVYSPRGNPFSS